MSEIPLMTKKEFARLVRKFRASRKNPKEIEIACNIASKLVSGCPIGCTVPGDISNFERNHRKT